jgi:hypothetical protein
VDGVNSTTVPLVLNLSAHTQVQAVFGRTVTVNDLSDGTGQGTLRYTLANAQEWDVITLNGVTAGSTVIELESPLEITEKLTIEGNGVILTPAASWTSDYYSQLLHITDTTAEVLIRRVHFKDGLVVAGLGGAINTKGILTLESCIFNNNRITNSNGEGGAIYSAGTTLTIQGCTFYGNGEGHEGGVVSCPLDLKKRTLNLTGNIFYGNIATFFPVVRSVSSYLVVNAAYNVVDVEYGTGYTRSGWDAGTGDKTTISDSDDLTITGEPFDTTTFVPVSGLSNVLPSPPPVCFPATDFHGTTRTFPGAPGAVK